MCSYITTIIEGDNYEINRKNKISKTLIDAINDEIIDKKSKQIISSTYSNKTYMVNL